VSLLVSLLFNNAVNHLDYTAFQTIFLRNMTTYAALHCYFCVKIG